MAASILPLLSLRPPLFPVTMASSHWGHGAKALRARGVLASRLWYSSSGRPGSSPTVRRRRVSRASFAFQDLLHRLPARGFVRFVHLRRQFQVSRGEAARKPVPAAAGFLDLAVFQVPSDQPRQPRPAPPGHLGHVSIAATLAPPCFSPGSPAAASAARSSHDLLLPPLPLKVNLLAGFSNAWMPDSWPPESPLRWAASARSAAARRTSGSPGSSPSPAA